MSDSGSNNFAQSFADCMQQAGVSVSASSVTEQSFFTDAVNYVKSWFDNLDSSARAALDAANAAGTEKVSGFLVDANIAPGIPDLMKNFDDASGWPISTLLDWCVHCIEQAAQASATSSH